MKILIAGFGSIGRRHFRNLVAMGQTDLVLYRTNRATLPDDELAGYPVETDLQDALEKHRPQAVVVANPTALHLEVAIPAAQAGCAILLEKPIAASLSRVDELRQAAQHNGNRILVGFQFRYHPTLNQAKELISNNRLGKILTAHAHWGEYLPNWHPWEDYRDSYAARADLGGGVIATLTHPLDYLRFLLGEIEKMSALHGHISPLELSDVEDVAEMSLAFASGAIGGVHVNYFQRPPVHRLEIVGTDGTLRWDNADGVLHFYQMPDAFGSISQQPASPIHETFSPPPGFERNHLFVEQTQHFLEVAAGKSAPICSLEDGIRVMELVVKAKKDVLSNGQK